MAEGRRHKIFGALGGTALAVSIGLGWLVPGAAPAYAGTALSVAVVVPSNYVVGQTGLPAAVQVTNMSVGGADGPLTVTGIVLTPACSSLSSAGVCTRVDPAVLTVSTTALGEAGTACEKVPFNVVPTGRGRVILAPTAAVVLGPPGGADDTCRVDFTISVVGAPTADAAPAPGVQTAATASATASQPVGTMASATGTALSTVPGGMASGTAGGTQRRGAGTASGLTAAAGQDPIASSSTSSGGVRAASLGFTSVVDGMSAVGLSTAGGRLVPAATVLRAASARPEARRPLGPALPASARLLSGPTVS